MQYRLLGIVKNGGTVSDLDFDKIQQSIDLLKSSGINYEFRTTFAPKIVEREDWPGIAELIRDAKLYALQPFRPISTLDPAFTNFTATPMKLLLEAADYFKDFVEKVEVRSS